jgi:small subunit ribosomal protein S6
MKKRYEGMLVLATRGGEESAKQAIERLEADFKKEGAVVEQIQRMGQRPFSYAAGDLTSGYYVNFVYQAEPAVLHRIQAKLKLDEEVYRQYHLLAVSKSKAA